MKKYFIILAIFIFLQMATQLGTFPLGGIKVSIHLLFKYLFLFAFLLMNIYLFYQEYNILKALRKEESLLTFSKQTSHCGGEVIKGYKLVTMEKGGKPSQTLKDIIFKYVPALLAYDTVVERYLKNRSEVQKAEVENAEKLAISQLKKNLNNAENDIRNTKEMVEAEKIKSFASIAEISDKYNKIEELHNKETRLNLELKNILGLKMELLKKSKEGKKLESEELKLLAKSNFIESDLARNSAEITKARENLAEKNGEYKKR